jgi:arabinose-5-phosphate isomerase
MANPKPLMGDASLDAVQSALRTLDAGTNGHRGAGSRVARATRPPFADAVELIRQAKGRVIVTGPRQIRAISRARLRRRLPPPARPAFFVHAAKASHGDLGMITTD